MSYPVVEVNLQDTQTAQCDVRDTHRELTDSQFKTHRPLSDTCPSPSNFQASGLFQCWLVLIWGLFVQKVVQAMDDTLHHHDVQTACGSPYRLETGPVFRLRTVIVFV